MYGKASQFLSALLALLPCPAVWAAGAEGPPRFAVAAPAAGKPLTFVVYGDPRFSRRGDISNSFARRSIVERIAGESPAAILIGGGQNGRGAGRGRVEISGVAGSLKKKK